MWRIRPLAPSGAVAWYQSRYLILSSGKNIACCALKYDRIAWVCHHVGYEASYLDSIHRCGLFAVPIQHRQRLPWPVVSHSRCWPVAQCSRHTGRSTTPEDVQDHTPRGGMRRYEYGDNFRVYLGGVRECVVERPRSLRWQWMIVKEIHRGREVSPVGARHQEGSARVTLDSRWSMLRVGRASFVSRSWCVHLYRRRTRSPTIRADRSPGGCTAKYGRCSAPRCTRIRRDRTSRRRVAPRAARSGSTNPHLGTDRSFTSASRKCIILGRVDIGPRLPRSMAS